MKMSRLAVCGLWIAFISILSSAVVKAQTTRPATTQPDTSAEVEPAAPRNAPVHFARSGHEIEIEQPLTFNRPIKTAVLRAFGRTWTEPFGVGGNGMVLKMKLTVPEVRVPTVFSVTWPEPPYLPFAELVAYPDRDVNWDKKLTVYSCGAPAWFDQWAAAVGLPVKKVVEGELPSAKLAPDEEDGRSLLILGASAAGRTAAEMMDRLRDKLPNAVVLNAAWMSPAGELIEVRPAGFKNALAPLAAQTWAKPLKFSDFLHPNRIICNRWALTACVPVQVRGGTMPVPPMEIVGALQRGPWVALIGLNWPEQLGRREEADVLLLETLRATAGFRPPIEMVRQGELLHPDKVIYNPRRMAYCPALACLGPGVDVAGASRVLILDLRSPECVTDDQLEYFKTRVGGMTEKDRLLVLGDDPILDRWEWLKIDRTNNSLNRPGAVWLADDRPWNETYEIPLMLKLTELGVPLVPAGQKEKQK